MAFDLREALGSEGASCSSLQLRGLDSPSLEQTLKHAPRDLPGFFKTVAGSCRQAPIAWPRPMCIKGRGTGVVLLQAQRRMHCWESPGLCWHMGPADRTNEVTPFQAQNDCSTSAVAVALLGFLITYRNPI